MEFWLEFIQEHVVTAGLLIVTLLSIVSRLKKHLRVMFNIVKEKADTKDLREVLDKVNTIDTKEKINNEILINFIKSQLNSRVIGDEIKEEYRKLIELYEKMGD